MRKLILTFTILLLSAQFFKASAQYYGSFVVQGDADKFYPVVFSDVDFNNNKATVLDIGRSNVHTDGNWRGSEIARFRFHTYNWGNSSNFIDADIRQFNPVTNTAFIAGWTDGTTSNGNETIIIWLKGGTNTYFVNAPVDVTATVYDGVQHPLPYQETNGPARTYTTVVQPYVNSNGLSNGGTAFFTGGGTSYFGSNVGIGTYNPGSYQLAVAGTVHAQAVNVDMSGWSDFVFNPSYKLASLADVKTYIDQNHHLPDVPSEEQVTKEGIDIGEMNSKLLKKIEELTLYLLEKDKELTLQNNKISGQQSQINRMRNNFSFQIKKLKNQIQNLNN